MLQKNKCLSDYLYVHCVCHRLYHRMLSGRMGPDGTGRKGPPVALGRKGLVGPVMYRANVFFLLIICLFRPQQQVDPGPSITQ